MVKIKKTQDDDQDFITIVESSLNTTIDSVKPEEVYVICIDHSFDHKWLSYSGKFEGLLPIWNKRLTVPAFNPNRVISIGRLRKKENKSSNRINHSNGRNQILYRQIN